ncbi:MAG: hypothetical protein LBV61_05400 [Burkholderiaceae bacterium]|nr:hypothetical protein [Burkholderiaceae bacterium]
MFKQAPLLWIVLMLSMFCIIFVLNFIPVIGSLLIVLLTPVFDVGMLAFAKGQTDNGNADITRFFTGFQNKTGALIGAGALYWVMLLVATVIVAILAFIVIGSSAIGGPASAFSGQAVAQMMANGMGLGLLLIFLVAIALMLLVTSAYWFAPALIAYANLSVMDAFRESFKAVWRNWLSLFVYGLLLTLMCIVAAIPFGLGLLVAAPVLMASNYPCFRDIFGRRPA